MALTRVEPLLYERAELEKLNRVLDGAGAFLLSVYSSYAIRAAQVTDWMHQYFPGVPGLLGWTALRIDAASGARVR